MFHKFKKPTIFVQKSLVWPLRFIFLLFVVYFISDMHEILTTNIAEYRHSINSARGEDDFRYWLKFIEKLVMGLFFALLAFNVKEKE
jgi:hypothetical protein